LFFSDFSGARAELMKSWLTWMDEQSGPIGCTRQRIRNSNQCAGPSTGRLQGGRLGKVPSQRVKSGGIFGGGKRPATDGGTVWVWRCRHRQAGSGMQRPGEWGGHKTVGGSAGQLPLARMWPVPLAVAASIKACAISA
jgi:hypothetical protein